MDCTNVTDIGPHLTEVLLALVGAVAASFTAYRSQQNHTILKNGGKPNGGPAHRQPDPAP